MYNNWHVTIYVYILLALSIVLFRTCCSIGNDISHNVKRDTSFSIASQGLVNIIDYDTPIVYISLQMSIVFLLSGKHLRALDNGTSRKGMFKVAKGDHISRSVAHSQ